ncbi:MAG TPA: alcohol dehydrogenase catalytic domain-containing protein [bacterium]|nr:alcohol dehydrogenase catalytic domain-containing protein [bacterium]
MRALYFDGARIGLKEVDAPRPGPGEALVRVRAAGICGTDLEIVKGYMGFVGVPGHEFAGVIVEAPDRSWIGRRVTGEINLACGHCRFCGQGLPRHCPNRAVLGIVNKDGAFAQYLTLPVANLHAVPDDLDDETAVFVEPVAACYEILEQAGLAGKRVAVLGDGKQGILAARVLAAEGVKEIALAGRHPEKLARAKADGITTFMISDLLAAAADPFSKFDAVVEATGRTDGFAAALACVRPRGVIIQKSTVAGPVPVDLSRVVVDEVTVIGSRCGPFPPAIRALAAGKVKVKDLISGRYPLARGEQAFAAASEPGAMKVVVSM